MSQTLLVNMPFSNLRWPNLGPSLLKAALAQRGIGCEIAYLNYDFAERIGPDRYNWIADFFAFVLGGERLFALDYFENLPDDGAYYRDVLLPADAGLTEADYREFLDVRRKIGPFLDWATAAFDWDRYAVVGFAASFQQTMPSMALARRIKQLRPEIKIVFGGAACEGPMGAELLRQFPVIDYVFLGEADLTFPRVVEQVLAGGPVALPPGVVGRGNAAGSLGEATLAVEDLDRLPFPDFDDYFARWRSSPLRDAIDPLLFFETSRGCWWGQKHQCLFCGLNGATIAFRSKSPRRAVDELKYLVERHGVHRGCSADNILDHRYFDTFLPMLRDARLDLGFVYEMKTNLTREQVAELLAAGLGAAQLGIETFSTPLLKLMDKGAGAVQNLQALKWFSEPSIEVKWNFLYGFPGEDPAEYEQMAALVPLLVHLHPPIAVGRVRLDRFSPYFQDPARHGMSNPRPNRAFQHVYPFPPDALAQLAYYWEFDYADGRSLDYARPLLDAVRQWQQVQGTATLRQIDRDDGVLVLSDTRPCATAFQHRLTGIDRALFLFCDTGRPLQKIVEHAATVDSATNQSQVLKVLDRFLKDRVMARIDDRYLSLALRLPSADPVP